MKRSGPLSRSVFPVLFLALYLCLPAFRALAAVYDVGPSRQYKTPGAVANLLKPGDEVRIDGDATYTGGTLFSINGTAALKIKVTGLRVNGKRPILSGGTNTVEAAGDHYEFTGLEITGGTSRCFFHHANDIVIRDAYVHNCPKQGILGADNDSGSIVIEYTEVAHCGGGNPDRDHQIYMATDETAFPGSVFRLQYSWIHDGDGGNNVKSRAERNEIYYNWFEGAYYHELELIGPDPAGGAGTSAREDSDVVGNVLVKTRDFAVVRFGGDGTGASSGRYRFVNNTVLVFGAAAIFRLFDPLQSVEMHNNVFTSTGNGAPNLLREVEAMWTDGHKVAGSNNWVKMGATNVPPEWTGTIQGAVPGFTNAGAYGYRPATGSGLIDSGAAATNGPAGFVFPSPLARPGFHPPERRVGAIGSAEARPVTGTIDIGAFEFGTPAGGMGGNSSTGGAGGAASGGSGGSTGTGGIASGGTGGGDTAGNNGNAGSGGTDTSSETADSGCSCRVGSHSTGPGGLALVLLGIGLGLRSRRRSGR
jgi:MYXO-CTERM domain-containing protein